MPDTHLNRIKQAVVSAPGTGIAVLGSAATGFKALGPSQNGQTFSVLWIDGSDWEVARGCTYTDAASTLSRGTLEDSSTGSRLSLTSAAVMAVVLPASRGAAWDALESSVDALETAVDGLAPVASSGDYNDLDNLPTLGTAAATNSTAYATAAQGAKADSALQPAIVDSKGDLIVATADNTLARLAVGTNGQVLTADSAESTGVKWATPSGGGGGGSGTKTLAVLTAMTSQPPATSFATLDTRNSIAVLDFGDTAEQATTWVGQIPEGANLSSGILVRIRWTATSATSGVCRWGVQFERMTTDIDSDSYDTATEANSTTNATSGVSNTAEITCTAIDSLTAGDLYRVRVYRDATDTGNDNMDGDAEIIAVELRQVA